MSYSLGVVQPRAKRFFGSDTARYEMFATTLAAGARWKVVAVIAGLAASGAGLVLADGDHRAAGWWVLVGVKVAVLVVASVAFWNVSWRMWPRRVFALPDEYAHHQRAFLRVGWTLAALVGTATVLGVAAAVAVT